jgi:tetratricopeptide (TPR) repeat protein
VRESRLRSHRGNEPDVTSAPPTSASLHFKRRRLLLCVVLAIAALGVAGAVVWWMRVPTVPAIPTEGLDADVVAAIAKARGDVAARPQSAGAWGRFGMVLFAHELYAASVPVFAAAERLDPADARWPYFRGLALIQQQPDEGVAALERAATLPSGTFSVRLELAEELLKLCRVDEADAHFRALFAEQPENPRALLGHGQVLASRGDWQGAVTVLRKIADHPTARRAARIALAEAYYRLGDDAEADRQRRLAEQAPNDLRWPDPFLLQAKEFQTGLKPSLDHGLELLAGGRVEEATAFLSRVVNDHPDSDKAHLALARVFIRAGTLDGAERELHAALQVNPALVEGHFLLAGTALAQGNYDAAERSYLRAIQLKPSYGLAYHNLGECRLKQGKQSQAAAAFREALRLRPDLTAAHLKLAELLIADGNAAEAILHLEEALRLDPRNDHVRRLLEQARART